MLHRIAVAKFASVCATAIALSFSHTQALGQELRPNGEPDPKNLRNVEDIALRAHQSYTNAIGLKCLQLEVRDGLAVLLFHAYWQIHDWERANRSRIPEKDSFYAERLANQVLKDYERLSNKDTCPETAFPTNIGTAPKLKPPSTGTPTPPPGTALPGGPGFTLTPGCQAGLDLSEVQTRIKQLLEERSAAKCKKRDAQANLILLSRLKKGELTQDEIDANGLWQDNGSGSPLPAGFNPSAAEADQNNAVRDADLELQRIDGDKQTPGALPRVREDEQRLRQKMIDSGTNPPNVVPNDLYGMCPATGLYGGLVVVKNSGHVRSIERLAATDAVTNQFSDDGDPLGGGIVVGYNARPWKNNIVVGPFASFDWLNQTINHTFPAGTFLGTTTHWAATTGAKAGLMTSPGILIYGLGGVSWLNTDLNINFATAASRNTTVPGFTLGLGGEYHLSALRNIGTPVSVFFQYQHTWWADANFNTPTSSPAFNYTFRREDDTVKFGLNFYFGQTRASASPSFPVKAPALK
jgi:opacity protein-like surface antigen